MLQASRTKVHTMLMFPGENSHRVPLNGTQRDSMGPQPTGSHWKMGHCQWDPVGSRCKIPIGSRCSISHWVLLQDIPLGGYPIGYCCTIHVSHLILFNVHRDLFIGSFNTMLPNRRDPTDFLSVGHIESLVKIVQINAYPN